MHANQQWYLIPTVCAQEEKAPFMLYTRHLSSPHTFTGPDSPVYPVTHHRRQCTSMTLATLALNCINTDAHPMDMEGLIRLRVLERLTGQHWMTE